MSGATGLLVLLLLSGRAAFTAGRSLNAPQHGPTDGTDSLTAKVSGNVHGYNFHGAVNGYNFQVTFTVIEFR